VISIGVFSHVTFQWLLWFHGLWSCNNRYFRFSNDRSSIMGSL